MAPKRHMDIRPSKLRFSQTTIKSTFTEGENINEVIREIINNRRSYNSFLPLEVAQDRENHKWYSQNNRRLYMFRVLEKHKIVRTIPVEEVTMRPKPSEAGSFVTFRDGTPTFEH